MLRNNWSLQKANKLLSEGDYTRIADPVERAMGYLDHVEKCSGQLWSGGCLLASFAVELADTHDRMQQAVSKMLQDVADGLATVFEPICAGADRGAPSASELADQYLGALEGAIILAKAHQDWTRIPRALRVFRHYLASWVPKST